MTSNNKSSIWAALNKGSRYSVERLGISSDVLQEMGYLWAFQQVYPRFKRNLVHDKGAVPLPELGPPTLGYEDICIMVTLKYSRPKRKRVYKSFTLRGQDQLQPFFEKGIILFDFSDSPIRLCKARICEEDNNNNNIMTYYVPRRTGTCGGEKGIPLGPSYVPDGKYEVYARLLRLTDNKSCCIYQPHTENDPDWHPKWEYRPRVLPLALSGKNSNSNSRSSKCLEELDFSPQSCGQQEGYIALQDLSLGYGCVGISQSTVQGLKIRARLPHQHFTLEACLRVQALPNKTLAMTALRFEAIKVMFDTATTATTMGGKVTTTSRGRAHPHPFCDCQQDNMGVTIHHILSNLHYPA